MHTAQFSRPKLQLNTSSVEAAPSETPTPAPTAASTTQTDRPTAPLSFKTLLSENGPTEAEQLIQNNCYQDNTTEPQLDQAGQTVLTALCQMKATSFDQAVYTPYMQHILDSLETANSIEATTHYVNQVVTVSKQPRTALMLAAATYNTTLLAALINTFNSNPAQTYINFDARVGSEQENALHLLTKNPPKKVTQNADYLDTLKYLIQHSPRSLLTVTASGETPLMLLAEATDRGFAYQTLLTFIITNQRELGLSEVDMSTLRGTQAEAVGHQSQSSSSSAAAAALPGVRKNHAAKPTSKQKPAVTASATPTPSKKRGRPATKGRLLAICSSPKRNVDMFIEELATLARQSKGHLRARVNEMNEECETPLMLLIYYGSKSHVDAFIHQFGNLIDLDQKDNDDDDTLEVAKCVRDDASAIYHRIAALAGKNDDDDDDEAEDSEQATRVTEMTTAPAGTPASMEKQEAIFFSRAAQTNAVATASIGTQTQQEEEAEEVAEEETSPPFKRTRTAAPATEENDDDNGDEVAAAPPRVFSGTSLALCIASYNPSCVRRYLAMPAADDQEILTTLKTSLMQLTQGALVNDLHRYLLNFKLIALSFHRHRLFVQLKDVLIKRIHQPGISTTLIAEIYLGFQITQHFQKALKTLQGRAPSLTHNLTTLASIYQKELPALIDLPCFDDPEFDPTTHTITTNDRCSNQHILTIHALPDGFKTLIAQGFRIDILMQSITGGKQPPKSTAEPMFFQSGSSSASSSSTSAHSSQSLTLAQPPRPAPPSNP